MRKFPQQVQTPLFQKEKTFSDFFIAFLKCAWNLKSFEKKYEYPSLIISQIIDFERGGYLNVWKVLIQNTIRLSTYLHVPNTAKISTAALFQYYPFFPWTGDILS